MGEKFDKMLDAVFKLVYGPPAQESTSQSELKKIQTAADVVAKLAETSAKIEAYEQHMHRVIEAIHELEEALKKTQVMVILSILLSIGAVLFSLLIK